MPLVTIGDRLVLRCINEPHRPVRQSGGAFIYKHAEPLPEGEPYDPTKPVILPKGETTMQELPGWGFVPGTSTPTMPGGPKVALEHGVPVKTYRCHVCGYMEFYSGVIVASDVWGASVKS